MPMQSTDGQELWREYKSLVSLFSGSKVCPPQVLSSARFPAGLGFTMLSYSLYVKNTSGSISCQESCRWAVDLPNTNALAPDNAVCLRASEGLSKCSSSIATLKKKVEKVCLLYYRRDKVSDFEDSEKDFFDVACSRMNMSYWSRLDSVSQVLFDAANSVDMAKWDEQVEMASLDAIRTLSANGSPLLLRAIAIGIPEAVSYV